MRDHHVLLLTTAPSLHASTLALASRIAARSNSVLLFFHVFPMHSSDGEAALYASMDLTEGRVQAWHRALLPTKPGVRCQHRFEVGAPEALVSRFVATHQVDLIVAEEPPRSWLSRALSRGLAERLVQRVDCPVVIGGPRFLQSGGASAPLRRAAAGHPTATADLLNAVVDARVEALRLMMDWRAEAAKRVAASETVLAAVASAHLDGHLDPRLERRLRVELDEHQRAHRAEGWQLSTPRGVWSAAPLTPTPCAALADFFQRLERRGQSTSLPLALDGHGEQLAVLSGARVREGDAEGVFLLRFDAEQDFLRILGQPGPLPSFETYAFDRTGLMLSNSQFPEHLLAAGLLPEEGLQTPLRLRVAEPGEGPPERWPLTRMAQLATLHQDGSDTHGYLDYRGTRVIGAWRWVPEYSFGVTAEVDHRVVNHS